MVATGIGFVYYDWYRRLALEATLSLEELQEGKELSMSRMRENPIISNRR